MSLNNIKIKLIYDSIAQNSTEKVNTEIEKEEAKEESKTQTPPKKAPAQPILPKLSFQDKTTKQQSLTPYHLLLLTHTNYTLLKMLSSYQKASPVENITKVESWLKTIQNMSL